MDGNFNTMERIGWKLTAELKPRRRTWTPAPTGRREDFSLVGLTEPKPRKRTGTNALRATTDPACSSWATFRPLPNGTHVEVVAAIGAVQSIDEVVPVEQARRIYRELTAKGWTRDDDGITPSRVRSIIRD